jgi:hypothetical protein
MKMNNFLKVSIVLAIIFVSCEEDNLEIGDDNFALSEYVSLETSIEEVESVVDEYALYAKDLDFDALSGKGTGHIFDRAKFFSSCVNFSVEDVDNTKTVTISFAEDCIDKRENTVSGMIIIVTENLESSKSRSILFTDFSVNGYVINGTRQYEHLDENENGNPQMSGETNLIIETEEETITKTGSRLVEVTAGGDTDSYEDNELTITGSHELIKADGSVFEMEIILPLVKSEGCGYIAFGVKEISKSGELSTLDYGDGTCDAIATLTAADGTITEIDIKRKKKHKKS